MSTEKSRKQTLFLAQFSILLALEVIICFTPLGTIPFPGIPATLSHIPVIIAAISLGTAAGAAMGFFFGLFSFIVMTYVSPGIFSFVFTPFYSIGDVHGNAWSLVICFIPRILLGVIAGECFRLFRKLSAKLMKSDGELGLVSALSGLVATLSHTVLVLGLIYLFFGPDYAAAAGLEYKLLLGALGTVILTNGLMEAFIAVVVSMSACPPLLRIFRLRQTPAQP
jgi:uncharacterized membrane protein